MFISDSFDVNEQGHLTVGGADAVDLLAQYGSPLYVLDEEGIRRNLRAFSDSIRSCYDGNGMVLYASKALCCKAICRIVAEEGCGLDVVSGGEIYTAWKAGFPMERAVFHGNNKTREELELALDAGVGRIVVDNDAELDLLDQVSIGRAERTKILLRIKPGIDAHTHDYIRTGQIDSKFGFALETGEAHDAVEKALSYDTLELVGLHCHIGSQIFEREPFTEAAAVMIRFMAKIRDDFRVALSELDLGGGFGIKYVQSDKPLPYGEFMRPVSSTVKAVCYELSMPVPRIMIEPGRAVVAPAGATLYTVGSIKTIPGVRTYVSVDGGMSDNPRYILYGADYEILAAHKAAEPKTWTVTLAGKCCESGDLIQENAPVQPLEVGDPLAVLATGAYNYSMASNYNRIPRLPVALVRDGASRLAVRRETYEDVIRLDV